MRQRESDDEAAHGRRRAQTDGTGREVKSEDRQTATLGSLGKITRHILNAPTFLTNVSHERYELTVYENKFQVISSRNIFRCLIRPLLMPLCARHE